MLDKKISIGFSVALAVLGGISLAVMPLFAYTAPTLDPFTQEELDENWVADRQYPSGGVDSVLFAGRDNVAKIGVVAAEQSTAGQFYYTEGIKKVGDFGTHVQVDLYVPSEWQDADVVSVGFWSSDDPITSYPIIAYRNSDTVEAGFYTWTYDWDLPGWAYVLSDVEVNYDDWNTLGISLSDTENVANYFINGEETGSVYNAGDFIGQVFLNHYNDGERDYFAHWHVGLEDDSAEPEYSAAPAIAAALLSAADIAPRYGSGRHGGNHIADVAAAMDEGTDFSGISKSDVAAYECAVAKFLRSKDTPALVSTESNQCFEYVESITVDSASIGGAYSSVLEEDAMYKFVASGTWQNGNLHTLDAECRLPTGANEWEMSDPRSLRLQVDDEYFAWGTSCAADHVYEGMYVGTGSPAWFRIVDGLPPVESWYNDNVGDLTVTIYRQL